MRFACVHAAIIAATISSAALAGNQNHHAYQSPIGVMGDHTHIAGDWMASYKYSAMTMSGNRSGSSKVSEASVLSNFMVAPRSMTMEMHMASLMYGVTDRLSVMGMASYVEKEMDLVMRNGRTFTTGASGAGDTKLSVTYALTPESTHAHHTHHGHHAGIGHQWFLNAGLSLPTGSVDERDDTPMMANAKLPYPMQLGSGTYDPMVGLTYVGANGIWGWGAQANATFRLGENDENYRLGNEYRSTLWGSAQVASGWNLSLRLEGLSWGDIKGSDSELNPMMVPTARTDLRGGERLDVLAGVSYQPAYWSGNRLGMEVGTPIYQHLDGPQLETDLRFMLSWQMVF